MSKLILRNIVASFLAITIFMPFLSCDDSFDEPIQMRDGNKIKLANKGNVHYPTYESFVENVNFGFRVFHSFVSNSIPYNIGENKYELVGYDQENIGWWEKATFGKWVEEYGLESNRIYYCATIKYISYIDRDSELCDYYPIRTSDDMGYIPNSKDPSFDIDMKGNFPKIIFMTGVRYIGYDNNLNGVYMRIPSLNSISWKYLKLF